MSTPAGFSNDLLVGAQETLDCSGTQAMLEDAYPIGTDSTQSVGH